MRANSPSIRHRVLSCSAAAALTACRGRQSALDPAGPGAERLAELFWWMLGGACVIWFAVVALSLYATYFAHDPIESKKARRLVIGGGVLFPTIILTGLLAYGLAILPGMLAAAPDGSLRIRVVGEQWWWRVSYLTPGGAPIELANEIRVPVGQPVEFELETNDVIHSFWIPSLGGKMDMIPGRKTRLRLEATRTGLFRGTCAEYCGASHAWMSFSVVVMEPQEFEDWLARQARPARSPEAALPARGQRLFQANGCGACHTVRGTTAHGRIGPDLTHVGSRENLAAGLLANDVEEFERWITRPDALKPGARMPAFGMLPREQVRAMAAYLETLE